MVVRLFGQLLLGVGGEVHGEALRGLGNQGIAAGADIGPAAAVMGAVLLGLQVVLHHAVHRAVEHAQPGGPVFVRVALKGPIAKVPGLLEGLGQEHAHAEPGQVGEAAVAPALQLAVNAAFAVNGPGSRYIHKGGHG